MTVNRWHSHPDARLRNSGDCIERHQWRVADLCRQICDALGQPVSRELLLAALYHDEAEREIGDLPRPARATFPALAAAYEQAAREIMQARGLVFDLTEAEEHILHFADRFDAWRWATSIGAGDCHEWRDEIAELRRMAAALGPAAVAWWHTAMAELAAQ